MPGDVENYFFVDQYAFWLFFKVGLGFWWSQQITGFILPTAAVNLFLLGLPYNLYFSWSAVSIPWNSTPKPLVVRNCLQVIFSFFLITSHVQNLLECFQIHFITHSMRHWSHCKNHFWQLDKKKIFPFSFACFKNNIPLWGILPRYHSLRKVKWTARIDVWNEIILIDLMVTQGGTWACNTEQSPNAVILFSSKLAILFILSFQMQKPTVYCTIYTSTSPHPFQRWWVVNAVKYWIIC